jgi:hypothetical protein
MADGNYLVSLTQSGGSDGDSAVYFGYKFTFDLKPYPILGQETPQGGYLLNLTVTK